MRFLGLFFLVLFLLSGCAPVKVVSKSESGAVSEFVLENGLKLIVKEDHRAPVVVSQVWYKVGSSYEHNGITGVSHVLEHMMFKGTKRYGPGEFSRIISENGGRENAFTGRDYTAYFQTLSSDRLEVSFRMESDRMRNLILDKEEFAKEVNVVKEERRLRTEDNPQARLYEQFMATAFVSSPYHHPIIGWMDDLQNMQIEDLAGWYRKWYAPNNATVVVVGDVEAGNVLALAKKYFGVIPKQAVATVKPQKEIPVHGQKRISVKVPAKVPQLMLGYQVPVLNTADDDSDIYALDVLASILDGGDSARLPARLVRQDAIASSAGAGYNMTARLDDVFYFVASPSNGVSIAQLERALLDEIELLRTEPVTDKELERVKAQVVAANVYEKDSVFYQAMQLGMLETTGLDWRLTDQYVDKINNVTAEQIRDVARKYFIEDQMIVAELKPLPIERDFSRRNNRVMLRH